LRSGERSFNPSGMLDLWDDVARIRCSTLILKGGESDILSSAGAEKLQAAIPGSTLAVIPAAGHSVMGDNPEAFVEAVRGFLQALGA
jgi:pimeloyl-ACP methyl ester carboxylesterase